MPGVAGRRGLATPLWPDIAPDGDAPERDSYRQVLLLGRLRSAVAALNPTMPAAAREDAIRQVLDLGTPVLLAANRHFHRLLVGGVPVQYQQEGACHCARSTASPSTRWASSKNCRRWCEARWHQPKNLLDCLRYFVLFEDDGQFVMKIAGYHQFYAVRTAIAQVVTASRPNSDGRLRGKGGGSCTPRAAATASRWPASQPG